jgi:hypothetical protein
VDCFPQRVGACPYIPERNRAGLSAAGVLFGMTDLEPPAFQAATCCHLLPPAHKPWKTRPATNPETTAT